MKRPKAIIMVTLDSARPDHLGCFGYCGADTPNIDRVAESGIVYEQAIAQATNTWVSHASIFTGCNPYKHGIRSDHAQLGDEVTTLAEALSQAGFATAGFPAHTLVGPARGFGRGFDLYDMDPNDFLHSSWDTNYYRDWRTMWAKAQVWMESQSAPFFVWLHYMGTHWEPHDKLTLPEEYRRKYSPYGQYYDGKISWADNECIGVIWNYLEEKGILDDSVFVILSDHGDDLPANDPPYRNGGHNKNLIDIVTKIVLIIRAPGWAALPTRINTQVRSIDIMPTLLELARASVPGSVEGRNVLPAHAGSNKLPDVSATAYAYMENMPRGWLGIRTEDWKLILTDNPEVDSLEKVQVIRISDWQLMMVDNPSFTPAGKGTRLKSIVNYLAKAGREALTMVWELRANIHPRVYSMARGTYRSLRPLYLRLGNWKWKPKKEVGPVSPSATESQTFEQRVPKEGRVFALYNLQNDPDERCDVSAQYPEVVQELKARLLEMTEGVESEIRDVDDASRAEIERRLKALGYL